MTRLTRLSSPTSARLWLTAILGFVGVGPTVRADLVSSDSFSGTPGQALAGMNGGTGFSGPWHAGNLGPDNSSQYVQQATSLDGGSIATSGGRVSSLASYSLGSGLSRDLATPIGQAGTTVFISMMMRADGTLNEGSSGGFFGLLLNASTTTPTQSQDLFIGKTGAGSNFGLENRGGGNSHLSSTSAAIGVSNLLVVEADFSATGPDKFTLFVNPTAANMGAGVVKEDSNLGMISSLSLYSTGAFSFDELRIGTTLGDVMPAAAGITANAVPEPGSILMLGLAGLTVAATARLRSDRQREVAA